MKIVQTRISLNELKQMSSETFGTLVKAVVDIKKELICLDGELHSDEEQILLEKGSQQKDLWGINLYSDLKGEDFIEFDSMINIRPSQNNRTRSVDDPKIQKQITKIINKIVQE